MQYCAAKEYLEREAPDLEIACDGHIFKVHSDRMICSNVIENIVQDSGDTRFTLPGSPKLFDHFVCIAYDIEWTSEINVPFVCDFVTFIDFLHVKEAIYKSIDARILESGLTGTLENDAFNLNSIDNTLLVLASVEPFRLHYPNMHTFCKGLVAQSFVEFPSEELFYTHGHFIQTLHSDTLKDIMAAMAGIRCHGDKPLFYAHEFEAVCDFYNDDPHQWENGEYVLQDSPAECQIWFDFETENNGDYFGVDMRIVAEKIPYKAYFKGTVYVSFAEEDYEPLMFTLNSWTDSEFIEEIGDEVPRISFNGSIMLCHY